MTEKNSNRQFIKIRGANEHNLKNIDLDIPRNYAYGSEGYRFESCRRHTENQPLTAL